MKRIVKLITTVLCLFLLAVVIINVLSANSIQAASCQQIQIPRGQQPPANAYTSLETCQQHLSTSTEPTDSAQAGGSIVECYAVDSNCQSIGLVNSDNCQNSQLRYTSSAACQIAQARQLCHPGARKCDANDLSLVLTCNSTGTEWNSTHCATGFSCQNFETSTGLCISADQTGPTPSTPPTVVVDPHICPGPNNCACYPTGSNQATAMWTSWVNPGQNCPAGNELERPSAVSEEEIAQRQQEAVQSAGQVVQDHVSNVAEAAYNTYTDLQFASDLATSPQGNFWTTAYAVTDATIEIGTGIISIPLGGEGTGLEDLRFASMDWAAANAEANAQGLSIGDESRVAAAAEAGLTGVQVVGFVEAPLYSGVGGTLPETGIEAGVLGSYVDELYTEAIYGGVESVPGVVAYAGNPQQGSDLFGTDYTSLYANTGGRISGY